MPRYQPSLPPQHMQTFQILAPADTHFRKATCIEVDCPRYLEGWHLRVEGLPPELLHDAKNSGRKWTQLDVAPGETWLVFEAGQPCFRAAEHRLRLDKPELFVVRGGDHRGNPRDEVRQHVRADDWVDDFATNQQKLVDLQQKG